MEFSLVLSYSEPDALTHMNDGRLVKRPDNSSEGPNDATLTLFFEFVGKPSIDICEHYINSEIVQVNIIGH